jgi:hypothetical protein
MGMKRFLEDLNKYWATPLIGMIAMGLGAYFTYIHNNLESEAKKIGNSAARIESELREREFFNALKIQMYNEVKDAISKKDSRLQNAVLLLVNEMLADDSLFRDKLTTVLLSSVNTVEEVKKEMSEIQKKEVEFIEKEESKIAENINTIDVFYLEDVLQEAKPRAEKLVNLLKAKHPEDRIRIRLLPRTINARKNLRIGENQIRYEDSEESLARSIRTQALESGIFEREQLYMKKVNPGRATPNYVSIFVRNM